MTEKITIYPSQNTATNTAVTVLGSMGEFQQVYSTSSTYNLMPEKVEPEPELLWLSATGKAKAVIFAIKDFDPTEHPRGPKGLFVDAPERIEVSTAQPGDVLVTDVGHGFLVTRNPKGISGVVVNPINNNGEIQRGETTLSGGQFVGRLTKAVPAGKQKSLRDLPDGQYVFRPDDQKRFIIAKRKPGKPGTVPTSAEVASFVGEGNKDGEWAGPWGNISMEAVDGGLSFQVGEGDEDFYYFDGNNQVAEAKGFLISWLTDSAEADQPGYVTLYPVDSQGTPDGHHLVLPESYAQFITSVPVPGMIPDFQAHTLQKPVAPVGRLRAHAEWFATQDYLSGGRSADEIEEFMRESDLLTDFSGAYDFQSYAQAQLGALRDLIDSGDIIGPGGPNWIDHLRDDVLYPNNRAWSHYIRDYRDFLTSMPGEQDPAEFARISALAWMTEHEAVNAGAGAPTNMQELYAITTVPGGIDKASFIEAVDAHFEPSVGAYPTDAKQLLTNVWLGAEKRAMEANLENDPLPPAVPEPDYEAIQQELADWNLDPMAYESATEGTPNWLAGYVQETPVSGSGVLDAFWEAQSELGSVTQDEMDGWATVVDKHGNLYRAELAKYEKARLAYIQRHEDVKRPIAPTWEDYRVAARDWLQQENLDLHGDPARPLLEAFDIAWHDGVKGWEGKGQSPNEIDTSHGTPDGFTDGAGRALMVARSAYAHHTNGDINNLDNANTAGGHPIADLTLVLENINETYKQRLEIYEAQTRGGDLGDMAIPEGLIDPPDKYAPGVGAETRILIRSDKFNENTNIYAPNIVLRVGPDGSEDVLGSHIDGQKALEIALKQAAPHEAIDGEVRRLNTEEFAKNRVYDTDVKVGDFLQSANSLVMVTDTGTVDWYYSEHGHWHDKVEGNDHLNKDYPGLTIEPRKRVKLATVAEANVGPGESMADVGSWVFLDEGKTWLQLEGNDPLVTKSFDDLSYKATFDDWRDTLTKRDLFTVEETNWRSAQPDSYVPELRQEWDISELGGQPALDAIARLEKLGFGVSSPETATVDNFQVTNKFGLRLRITTDDTYDHRITGIDKQSFRHVDGSATAQEYHEQLTALLEELESPDADFTEMDNRTARAVASLYALNPEEDPNLEAREAHARQIVYDMAVARFNQVGKDPIIEPTVKTDAEYRAEAEQLDGFKREEYERLVTRDIPVMKFDGSDEYRVAQTFGNAHNLSNYTTAGWEFSPEDDSEVLYAIHMITHNAQIERMMKYGLIEVRVEADEEGNGGQVNEISVPAMTVGRWYGSQTDPQTVRTMDDLPVGAMAELANGIRVKKVGVNTYDAGFGSTDEGDVDFKQIVPPRFALPHTDIAEAAWVLSAAMDSDSDRIEPLREHSIEVFGDRETAWANTITHPREKGVSAVFAAKRYADHKFDREVDKQRDQAITDWTEEQRETENTIAVAEYRHDWGLPTWEEIDFQPQTLEDIEDAVRTVGDKNQDVPIFFTGGIIDKGIAQVSEDKLYARVEAGLDQKAVARMKALGAEHVDNSQDLNDIYTHAGSGPIFGGDMWLITDDRELTDYEQIQKQVEAAGDWATNLKGPNNIYASDYVGPYWSPVDAADAEKQLIAKAEEWLTAEVEPNQNSREQYISALERRLQEAREQRGSGRIEYVPHTQDGDSSPTSGGLTTGAPTSQRGQIRITGYSPAEAIDKLQELGFVHDLEPEVPFQQIMRSPRRYGRVRPLLSEYIRGDADLPEPEYSLTHSLTGGEADLHAILDSGAMLAIAERNRLGIRSEGGSSEKGDVRSGIDRNLFFKIGFSTFGRGKSIIFLKDSAYLADGVLIASHDYGGQETRYGDYQREMDGVRAAVGDEPGTIYEKFSPQARAEWIENRVDIHTSNEWNVHTAAPIDDWELLVVEDSQTKTAVQKHLAQMMNDGLLYDPPVVTIDNPQSAEKGEVHRILREESEGNQQAIEAWRERLRNPDLSHLTPEAINEALDEPDWDTLADNLDLPLPNQYTTPLPNYKIQSVSGNSENFQDMIIEYKNTGIGIVPGSEGEAGMTNDLLNAKVMDIIQEHWHDNHKTTHTIAISSNPSDLNDVKNQVSEVLQDMNVSTDQYDPLHFSPPWGEDFSIYQTEDTYPEPDQQDIQHAVNEVLNMTSGPVSLESGYEISESDPEMGSGGVDIHDPEGTLVSSNEGDAVAEIMNDWTSLGPYIIGGDAKYQLESLDTGNAWLDLESEQAVVDAVMESAPVQELKPPATGVYNFPEPLPSQLDGLPTLLEVGDSQKLLSGYKVQKTTISQYSLRDPDGHSLGFFGDMIGLQEAIKFDYEHHGPYPKTLNPPTSQADISPQNVHAQANQVITNLQITGDVEKIYAADGGYLVWEDKSVNEGDPNKYFVEAPDGSILGTESFTTATQISNAVINHADPNTASSSSILPLPSSIFIKVQTAISSVKNGADSASVFVPISGIGSYTIEEGVPLSTGGVTWSAYDSVGKLVIEGIYDDADEALTDAIEKDIKQKQSQQTVPGIPEPVFEALTGGPAVDDNGLFHHFDKDVAGEPTEKPGPGWKPGGLPVGVLKDGVSYVLDDEVKTVVPSAKEEVEIEGQVNIPAYAPDGTYLENVYEHYVPTWIKAPDIPTEEGYKDATVAQVIAMFNDIAEKGGAEMPQGWYHSLHVLGKTAEEIKDMSVNQIIELLT